MNLKDKEIRLEANQTKTKEARTVAIGPALLSWLKAYEGKEFFPANWRKDFEEVKRAIGYGSERKKKPSKSPRVVLGRGKYVIVKDSKKKKPELKPWPEDVLRHTAISHYFRKCKSFGDTAEQMGNSEAIIRKHYKARVSTSDTDKFYALRPRRKGRK